MSELRTNKIYPRDGLPADAWGGGIVQVKYATLDTSTTVTTFTDVLTLSFTPKSASNKVLLDLRARTQLDYNTSGDQWYIGITRSIDGGSEVWVSGAGKNSTSGNPTGRYAFHVLSNTSNQWNPGVYVTVPDLPATTGTITYTVSIGPWGAATGSLRLNRQNGDGERDGLQLIAYEISG